MLDIGVFPAMWKSVDIVLVPEGNDKDLSDSKSCHPIRLLPVMDKILERLIDIRLKAHHIAVSPLSVRQLGFSGDEQRGTRFTWFSIPCVLRLPS